MKREFVKKCVRMAFIWGASTVLAVIMDQFAIRAENLLLVYMLGVIICILALGSLYWALWAAVLFTYTFNSFLQSRALPFIWAMSIMRCPPSFL